MKKVLLTALSLVMVGSVLLSAAGPNGPNGPKYVQIFGVITDFSYPSLTVLDLDEITTTVEVTEDTVVMECGELGDFDDLDIGDIVKVRWVSGEPVAKINILCELPALGL